MGGAGPRPGEEQGAWPENPRHALRAVVSPEGADRPNLHGAARLPRVHPVAESCPEPPGRPGCLLSVVSRSTCLFIFTGLWRPTPTLAAQEALHTLAVAGTLTPSRSFSIYRVPTMCPSQQPTIDCRLSSWRLQPSGDTEMSGVGNLVEEEMQYLWDHSTWP